jgi:two-component system chemotaxis response regulator CheY
VVVVSTEGSQTRIERLRGEGTSFVHKPFTPEGVREVLVELMGASHDQQIHT